MPQSEGFGAPGAPRGEVLTIQGAPGMTPVTIAGAGSGGASQADDSAFTTGTDEANPVGGLVDDVATGAVAEGSVGVLRMSASRVLYANPRSATATTSSVADSATSVSLLAANTARVGATVYNDSTEALYLKLGATASLTDFTVKLVAGAYYEAPYGYVGAIDGIWAANASGSARITEVA